MTGSGTMNWLRQSAKWVFSHAVNSSPQLNVQSFQEITGCNDKAFASAFTTVMRLTILITCHFQHFSCGRELDGEKERGFQASQMIVCLTSEQNQCGAEDMDDVQSSYLQNPEI